MFQVRDTRVLSATFSQLNVKESADEGRTKGSMLNVGKENWVSSRSSLKEEERVLSTCSRPPKNKRRCQEPSSHQATWWLEQAAKEMSPPSKVKTQERCRVSLESGANPSTPLVIFSLLNREPLVPQSAPSILEASAGLTASHFLDESWTRGMSLGRVGLGGAAPLPPEPRRASGWAEAPSPGGGVQSLEASGHADNPGPDRREQPGLILPDFVSVLLWSLDKTTLI